MAPARLPPRGRAGQQPPLPTAAARRALKPPGAPACEARGRAGPPPALPSGGPRRGRAGCGLTAGPWRFPRSSRSLLPVRSREGAAGPGGRGHRAGKGTLPPACGRRGTGPGEGGWSRAGRWEGDGGSPAGRGDASAAPERGGPARSSLTHPCSRVRAGKHSAGLPLAQRHCGSRLSQSLAPAVLSHDKIARSRPSVRPDLSAARPCLPLPRNGE